MILFNTAFTLLQIRDFKNDVNTVLNNVGLPLFLFFIVIGTVIGVVQNYEKIVDKDGNGTRKEGLFNVGIIVLYVVIACAVIAGVIALVGRVSLRV